MFKILHKILHYTSWWSNTKKVCLLAIFQILYKVPHI